MHPPTRMYKHSRNGQPKEILLVVYHVIFPVLSFSGWDWVACEYPLYEMPRTKKVSYFRIFVHSSLLLSIPNSVIWNTQKSIADFGVGMLSLYLEPKGLLPTYMAISQSVPPCLMLNEDRWAQVCGFGFCAGRLQILQMFMGSWLCAFSGETVAISLTVETISFSENWQTGLVNPGATLLGFDPKCELDYLNFLICSKRIRVPTRVVLRIKSVASCKIL